MTGESARKELIWKKLRLLSEPLALRILELFGEGPLCVCLLRHVLCVDKLLLSRELIRLKGSRLLNSQGQGSRTVYAALPCPLHRQVRDAVVLQDKEFSAILQQDSNRLTSLISPAERANRTCFPNVTWRRLVRKQTNLTSITQTISTT